MELEKFFQEYKDKKNAYDLALSSLYFDMETVAPVNGIPYRNRMISILSGDAFDHIANPESIKKIEELSQRDSLSETEKKEITLLLKELEDLRVLPREVYVDFQKIIADGQNAWRKAKEENDYQMFKPYLIQIIEKQKEVLSYIKK